jgi:hypothetical protein
VRGIRTVEASFTLTPPLSPHRERELNVKILFTFVLLSFAKVMENNGSR